jgi:hypothetical protein
LCFELLECRVRFREQRGGLVEKSVIREPLGVLELREREIKAKPNSRKSAAALRKLPSMPP